MANLHLEHILNVAYPRVRYWGHSSFLLYINDLNCVSSILDNIMFADDTNLFLTGKSLADVEEQMNQELLLITEYFQSNRLSLNITKTSYLIFGNNKNQGRHFNFFLGGQIFFKFFNATGLLKNLKNSTLYVVI